MSHPLPDSAIPTTPASKPVTPSAATLLPSIKFGKQLAHFVASSKTKPELVRKIAATLKNDGCHGLWIVAKDKNGQWTDPISLFGDDSQLRDLVGSDLATTTSLAISNRSLVSLECKQVTGNVLLGMPTFVGEDLSDLLVGLFPATGSAGHSADWVLTSACQSITQWQMNLFIQSTQEQVLALSKFVNLSAAVNRSQSRLEASITLVNELKAALDVECVSLLLRNGSSKQFRLAAMSGVEFFDRNAGTTQVIESSVLGTGDEAIFWSPNLDAAVQPAIAESATELPDMRETTVVEAEQYIDLQNYCDEFAVAGCALLPIRNSEEKKFGWVVISLKPNQVNNPKVEKHFRQISALVAGHMEMVLKSQRTLRQLSWDSLRRTVKHNWARKIAVLLAVATIMMCVPFTYKVSCDCQLQLTRRRFIAAPYEGVLEKSLVENGELVEAGQPLARMDASQLRMEISALESTLGSESKKRDSALARGSIAESQIARSEMQRLSSEIEILNKHLGDTEICSPLRGIVVSGDLDKAEGAPLEMGQNLFEVGPLDNMLVEVQIPESEACYVDVGMKTDFEFEAFPFETFTGTIRRIHPRAEIVGHESVFVAEIELANETGRLRPGMKGRSKIFSNRHPLGWNLFHGAVEKARQWLIW